MHYGWEDVRLEAQELKLPDSKTGPRTVTLSPEAAAVLASIERLPGNPWVIPGSKPGQRLSSLFEPWRRVRARAGLDNVRLHDLRHSYASRALALGESLPVIAKLLGHAQIQTTARYTHLTRDAVRDAATRVAGSIGEDILPTRGPDRPRAAVRETVSAIPFGGRVARGTVQARGALAPTLIVKASMKASAARVAADIGADILPSRTCRAGLVSPGRAAGVAARAS